MDEPAKVKLSLGGPPLIMMTQKGIPELAPDPQGAAGLPGKGLPCEQTSPLFN